MNDGGAAAENNPASQVLFESGFLAGAVVDHIHGCLPQDTPHVMRTRIEAALDGLLRLANSMNSPNSFRWHEVCLARRIVNRVLRATSPGAHRHAVDQGLTTSSVEDIATLTRTLFRLDALVLRRASQAMESYTGWLVGRQNDGEAYEMPWEDFVSVYEGAIIHRTRGNVTKAIEPVALLSKGLEKDTLRTQPSMDRQIAGLAPFYPRSLAPEDGDAAKLLLSLSLAVSHRSRHARALGIDEVQRPHDDTFRMIALRVKEVLEEYQNVHPHGLLHLENMFRVCVYQAAWFVGREMEGSQDKPTLVTISKTWLSDLSLRVYNLLNARAAESTELEPWMKSLMRATFDQNKGVLIAEIAPAIIPRQIQISDERGVEIRENTPNYDSFERFRDELWFAIDRGWKEQEDQPAYLKHEFWTKAMNDMTVRAQRVSSDHSSETLGELSRWLGDPTKKRVTRNNDRTIEANLERTSGSTASLHLAHLPQGGINRAQVAVGLAYMQSIMRATHNAAMTSSAGDADAGAFHALDELFVSNRDGDGSLRVTADSIPGKLQVTMKHKNSKNDKMSLKQAGALFENHQQVVRDLFKSLESGPSPPEFRKKYADVFSEYRRSNLTRVHRQDTLMFIGKALDELNSVLHNQLSANNYQQRLEDAARQCRLDEEMYRPGVKPPHVHELLYLAADASVSPLRLVDVKFTRAAGKGESAQRQAAIDALLRASMARIYALSVRTEIVTRMLLEKPLREPYQSGAVLLIDQIRVLLRFFHTDWLLARRSHDYAPAHDYDGEIMQGLNLFTNERRHRPFQNTEIPDLMEEEVRNEPAVSYIIEYGLKEPEDCHKLMSASKERLNFGVNDAFGAAWDDVLLHSLVLHKEQLEKDDELRENVAPEDENAQRNESLPTEERKVEEAMELLRQNTTREWILWARLALYPTCFVGRSLLSGTTTKDLNMGLKPDPRRTESIALPMVFRTVRDAIVKPEHE